MLNQKVIKILWIALAIEVAVAALFLIFSRNIASLIVITIILGIIGGAGYVSGWLGWWVENNKKPPVQPLPQGQPVQMGANNMSGNLKSFFDNIGNINVNLNSYPERREVINLNLPLAADAKLLHLNVLSGALRLTGQPGLQNEVQIVATRRVWAKDEAEARQKFDRLQVRHWLDGSTFRVEAGDPQQGIVIGDASRIDIEINVPQALATILNTSMGELVTRNYNGKLTAKSAAGTIDIENYSSGRDVSIQTSSGQIRLNNVAAGKVHAKSLAGMMQLTGVGAEQVELETTAGGIRARGINGGRFAASATTGLVELVEASLEVGLEMKTGAGRIYVENVQPNAMKLEAATGAISYRGGVPKAPSDVSTGAGSIALQFAQGTGYNLDARSNLGVVEVHVPATAGGAQNRNYFAGQVGGGGAPIRVISQVGSVKVG
jgi:DUF4097 and DUF4098 domain-containing protein YvlB